MNEKKIAIMVAAHKSYQFPDDTGYIPVHVGKALNPSELGFGGDDSGDNISELNKSFCELTGLYWLWKNTEAEYYGLAHYRRYFKALQSNESCVNGIPVASSNNLMSLLGASDVIVSKKRCYLVDTIRSHYIHSHYESDLDQLEKLISERYPEYKRAFDYVMNQRCMHLYNMFVMNRILFQDYCKWVFDILFELETTVPYKDYGPYQGRVFGFLSERLLNVWLKHKEKEINVKELPVVNLEGENFLLKVVGLLKRKLTGVKLD